MKRKQQSWGSIFSWGLWSVWVLLVITGCEGSGSSGFDQNPRLAQEQAVIASIATTTADQCLAMEGVSFCSLQDDRADRQHLVSLTPLSKGGVTCVPNARSKRCEFKMNVEFKDQTGSSSVQLRAGVRYHHPFSSPWKMASVFVAPSDSKQFEAVIPFELSAEGTAQVDLAVLAYLDAPQETLPEIDKEQLLLVDFKPFMVFVATKVAVKAEMQAR